MTSPVNTIPDSLRFVPPESSDDTHSDSQSPPTRFLSTMRSRFAWLLSSLTSPPPLLQLLLPSEQTPSPLSSLPTRSQRIDALPFAYADAFTGPVVTDAPRLVLLLPRLVSLNDRLAASVTAGARRAAIGRCGHGKVTVFHNGTMHSFMSGTARKMQSTCQERKAAQTMALRKLRDE